MSEEHYNLEDEFHGRDRKASRKERKQAVSSDRSKFKKTDQDQLKKQKDSAGPEEYEEGLKMGRVLAITPEGMIVSFEDELYTCVLKGALKKENLQIKNLVAVGDIVRFLPMPEKEGLIAHIEPRRSILSRADNLSQRKEQLIAVNVDQVIITCSVMLPPLKPFLIDRYIIAARKGNMEPVIAVNKIDFFENPPELIDKEHVEEEKTLYDEFLEIYRALNIPVFPVSAETGAGMEELKNAMKEKTSVFSGQSGVGKSSLINTITGHSMRIGDIVEKTRKGSHTTTSALLIPLEGGGFCIDTPGIKSFGVWDLDPEEIKHYFSEIAEIGADCKFPDCQHLHEPECAVKKAVEEERISALRYASYCALIASCTQEHRPR